MHEESPAGKAVPSSEDVGRLYDENTDVVDGAAGGNIHSGYWESEDDHSSLDEATYRLTDLVTGRLAVEPGQRLLDIGCGTGNPALRVAARDEAKVVGISVSQEEIALARARAAESGLTGRVSFQYADAMALPVGTEPFAAESFDGAWAIESLMHMSDRAGALAGAARTLRPGGRLVVADVLLRRPVHGETAEFVEQMCQAFQAPGLPGPEDYQDAVRRAGLELLEFTDIGENVRRTYRAFARILSLIHISEPRGPRRGRRERRGSRGGRRERVPRLRGCPAPVRGPAGDRLRPARRAAAVGLSTAPGGARWLGERACPLLCPGRERRGQSRGAGGGLR
ncbi:methyltransferase domain-containing protein [Streptomyces sp. WAC 00631]|uniref:SAM-dependent methyltransferase n=1 Tax=Streptomyces sp. WAC 00631 TaxID=2203201 RepID=UPI001E5EC2E1|nr:methyltransferase domain-containing protein [Streptomyces sp. WAC 00631]MCC5036356.1 methyltransferase domain-containing protein [Streptomyces sp. WAC 00631]